jgi:hypothetical protein
MARTAATFLLLLALGLVPDSGPLGAQASPAALLGRWHGTSICTKASWNAACNDEEVFYDFVQAPRDPPRILLHAYKRVGPAIEPMGDLEFLADTGRARWAGEFSNTRVHIRWMFQVADSGLTGGLTLLPSGQLARTVRAQRDSTWSPPAD